MKIVINTGGYDVGSGTSLRITLPNGKYYFTGINSIVHARAEDNGLECKIVEYYGACNYMSINKRAHMGFPIQIDEVSVVDFIDKIATEEEAEAFLNI